ncbi:hypothetical protein [Mesorhizobium sp. M0199]|uniref:hypothetical protein n=1 Tax=Mesorhizobium sp. M0199 TaxID=2956911 RepID=UPI003339ADEA
MSEMPAKPDFDIAITCWLPLDETGAECGPVFQEGPGKIDATGEPEHALVAHGRGICRWILERRRNLKRLQVED